MRHEIQLVVNGRAVSREVDTDRLPVQWLREDLAPTGTHVGCDTAQRGACTVHLNGQAVKACNLLAVQVGAQSVSANGLNSDLHGTSEYRATRIPELAARAVAKA